MNTDTWVLFFVAYLITTLSPGPNVLLVIKNSVQYGKNATVITICANLFCQLLIVILVAFGIGKLLLQMPLFFLFFKVLGGLYLMSLGIMQFKSYSKISVKTAKMSIQKSKTNWILFKEAFLVSASNPKTIIFLSAFLPQFVVSSHSLFMQFFIMFLTICLIVSFVHVFYAYLMSYIKQHFKYVGIQKYLKYLGGVFFIGMGCGVLLTNNK